MASWSTGTNMFTHGPRKNCAHTDRKNLPNRAIRGTTARRNQSYKYQQQCRHWLIMCVHQDCHARQPITSQKRAWAWLTLDWFCHSWTQKCMFGHFRFYLLLVGSLSCDLERKSEQALDLPCGVWRNGEISTLRLSVRSQWLCCLFASIDVIFVLILCR